MLRMLLVGLVIFLFLVIVLVAADVILAALRLGNAEAAAALNVTPSTRFSSIIEARVSTVSWVASFIIAAAMLVYGLYSRRRT